MGSYYGWWSRDREKRVPCQLLSPLQWTLTPLCEISGRAPSCRYRDGEEKIKGKETSITWAPTMWCSLYLTLHPHHLIESLPTSWWMAIITYIWKMWYLRFRGVKKFAQGYPIWKWQSSIWNHGRGYHICYGLNCVLSKFVCWWPNPQYLTVWRYLEMGSFRG